MNRAGILEFPVMTRGIQRNPVMIVDALADIQDEQFPETYIALPLQ
jgi:hypothetical protein